MLSPPSQFMPYILSSEIPFSDSGFLLIKRKGTALTLKVLTQKSGALGPSFPTSYIPHKIMRMYDQQFLSLYELEIPLDLR